MTIRTRLTFLYASLLALAMLLFSAASLSVLNWTLRRQVDETLLKAASDMHMDVRLENPFLSEMVDPQINSMDAPGVFWQVWLHDPDTQAPMLTKYSLNLLGVVGYALPLDPAALSETREVRRDVMHDGYHLRVATIPLVVNGQVRGYIQTAQSLRTVDAAIDRLLKIMLVGGALTLVASLLAGDYLMQRALRPIDTIAQTAQQITAADDLSRRIPYDGPPDELGQLTETFNETLERLERLFNVQRRFVADVSHEMRTPLTTIRGNVDLMRRFGYDEEAVAAIDSEARRMTRLVEDLLMLARADAKQLPIEKNPVDLDTLVMEVYRQAQILAEEAVTVQLGTIEPARVLGDADKLKQLLLNLVSNGIKYTPEGGSVTLSVIREAGWVRASVVDTGIGIPAEHLPHLFDRFYRVDKARSRAKGGTGLGLSIAKWIAEVHGGQLSATSSEGQGSTFTLTLPTMPESPSGHTIRDTIPNMRAARLPRSLR